MIAIVTLVHICFTFFCHLVNFMKGFPQVSTQLCTLGFPYFLVLHRGFFFAPSPLVDCCCFLFHACRSGWGKQGHSLFFWSSFSLRKLFVLSLGVRLYKDHGSPQLYGPQDVFLLLPLGWRLFIFFLSLTALSSTCALGVTVFHSLH